MAISVHCGECGKSFQVRDELAGRRGRCPKGHPIEVPLVSEAAEVRPEDDFAFLGESKFGDPPPDPAPVVKASRRASRAEPVVQPAAGPTDDFAFPTPSLIGSDRTRSRPRRPASTAGPNPSRRLAPARRPASRARCRSTWAG